MTCHTFSKIIATSRILFIFYIPFLVSFSACNIYSPFTTNTSITLNHNIASFREHGIVVCQKFALEDTSWLKLNTKIDKWITTANANTANDTKTDLLLHDLASDINQVQWPILSSALDQHTLVANFKSFYYILSLCCVFLCKVNYPCNYSSISCLRWGFMASHPSAPYMRQWTKDP